MRSKIINNFYWVYLQAADIVLVSQERNWLAKMIRKFSTFPNDKTKTEYSHTAIVLNNTYGIIEALDRVRITNLFRYEKGYRVLIARRIDLSGAENLIINKAHSYLGRQYGAVKLITHLLDYCKSRITGKDSYTFRKLTQNDYYPICSWLVAYSFYCVKRITFNNCPPGFCQPDDIADDILIVNPDKYKILYRS